MAIKVITSSTFHQKMKDAFTAGVVETGHPQYDLNPLLVDFQEISGNYDDAEGQGAGSKKQLYTAFDDANKDVDPVHGRTWDVIVSAGGLVSAHAAQDKVKDKPFLILVGQLPKFAVHNKTKSRFFGGVNLDMVGQNLARYNYLVGHYGVARDKVYLVWNQNSKMGKDEKKEWKRSTTSPDQVVQNNQPGDITGAIDTAVGNGAQAFVISGDPYFASEMNTLVDHVNSKNLPACYPFATYMRAQNQPKKDYSMIYGPDLEFAYRLIGRKAGIILDNQTEPPDTGLDPSPIVGPIFIGK